MCGLAAGAAMVGGMLLSQMMAPDMPSMPSTPMPQPTTPTPPPPPIQPQPEVQPQQQTQRPTNPQEIRKANSAATPNVGPAATPADTWLTGPTGIKLTDSSLKKQSLLGG